MNSTRRLLSAAAATLLVAWYLGPYDSARADTDADTAEAQPTLPVIVVTAQKRAENLETVPISISAYDRSDLEREGVHDISDIARIAPGVTLQSQGPFNNLSIRGISSSAGSATSGIYLNDVPLQIRRPALNLVGSGAPDVFDLDRVEVLRGPQGTYFGAGAEAGAIRFITPTPSLTRTTGFARGGFSGTESGGIGYEAGVALGGPLVSNTVGYRISVWRQRQGGYIDHYSSLPGGVQESASNWQDSSAINGALLWKPSDAVSISPSLYYQDIYANDLSSVDLDRSAPFDPSAQRYQSNFSNGTLVNGGPPATPDRDWMLVPALKGQFDLWHDVTLTSITGYVRRNHSTPLDYSTVEGAILNGTPYPTSAFLPTTPPISSIWRNVWTYSQRSFSQEIRLQNSNPDARLKWTLGGWYSNAKGRVETHALWPGLPYQTEQRFGQTMVQHWKVDMLPGGVAFHAINPTDDKQLAAFGQIDYRLIGRLTLTLGARYAHQESSFSELQEGPLAGGLTTSAGVQKENVLTPKYGLSYQLTDDSMVYTSAAKGNRMGGANAALIVIPGSQCLQDLADLGVSSNPGQYKSDFVWSYEAGSKNRLLNGRMMLNASVYYMNWNNLQQAIGVPSCSSSFTTNVGTANSKGFDLTLDAQVTSQFMASVAVGYTDAKITQTVAVPSGKIYVESGDQINPYSSPWNVTASLEYSFNIFSSAQSYVQLNDVYDSKNPGPFTPQHLGTASYSPLQTYNPATNRADLRIGATASDWDVALYCNNLANSHPLLYVVAPGKTAPLGRAYTFRSRTAGVTATYKW